MKRLPLAIALLLGTLSIGSAPAGTRADWATAAVWPSFAKVAPTARTIVIVKVTESLDDIARKARLVDVMKGGSQQWLDLRDLEPGRASDDCLKPSGPHAQIGDRLAIAFYGTASDRARRVDAVAHVGRMRDRPTFPGSNG